jgi:hypothetical protein
MTNLPARKETTVSGPKVSNKRQRDAQRAAHIVGGLMLGIYIYVPLVGGPAPQFAAAAVQFVVFPAVVATGVLMWQLPRLRRLLKKGRGPNNVAG